jgi:hypothetical protein
MKANDCNMPRTCGRISPRASEGGSRGRTNIKSPPSLILDTTLNITCLQYRNTTSATLKINICNIKYVKIVATSATFENK